MPKRKNPFGGVPPLQLKVHVSAKHVASQEDMEEVCKRTKERLFHKVKVMQESNSYCVQKGDEEVKPSCRCCKGQILVPGFLCSSCHHQLCGSSCLQECCRCEQSFCHFCTVLNYDKPQERTFCFNCLSSSFSS